MTDDPKGLVAEQVDRDRAAAIPSAWKRYRFRTFNEDDPRPVKFPPPGPYWISGYGDGYAVLIAYLPADCDEGLQDYWPDEEAHEWWDGYDCQDRPEIAFTDRFPRPEWWTA